MIETGQHIEFIIGAYLITIILASCLIFWITRDYKIQARKLQKLEEKGIRRRSDETPQ